MRKEELESIISQEKGVLLYFFGEDCGLCGAVKPKISEMFDVQFPLLKQIYIDAKEHPETASAFGVFSIPAIIIYLQGQEFAREGRTVSLQQLSQKIERVYSIMTGEE